MTVRKLDRSISGFRFATKPYPAGGAHIGAFQLGRLQGAKILVYLCHGES